MRMNPYLKELVGPGIVGVVLVGLGAAAYNGVIDRFEAIEARIEREAALRDDMAAEQGRLRDEGLAGQERLRAALQDARAEVSGGLERTVVRIDDTLERIDRVAGNVETYQTTTNEAILRMADRIDRLVDGQLDLHKADLSIREQLNALLAAIEARTEPQRGDLSPLPTTPTPAVLALRSDRDRRRQFANVGMNPARAHLPAGVVADDGGPGFTPVPSGPPVPMVSTPDRPPEDR